MKTAAYIPLHYGAEYLDAAIRQIDPFVEKIFVIYSDRPSHGSQTIKACPETEQQLKDVAFAASPKIQWIQKNFPNEGAQRNYAETLASGWGYDILLAVDADEVWDQKALHDALSFAENCKTRYVGIEGFVNFWRSFNHACYDGFAPIRIINLKNKSGTSLLRPDSDHGPIFHFSCAQRDEIMNYKYEIHGHKSEIRAGWLRDIYYGWRHGDRWLHPVSTTIWEKAEQYDKSNLPDILKQHPNFGKEVII